MHIGCRYPKRGRSKNYGERNRQYGHGKMFFSLPMAFLLTVFRFPANEYRFPCGASCPCGRRFRPSPWRPSRIHRGNRHVFHQFFRKKIKSRAWRNDHGWLFSMTMGRINPVNRSRRRSRSLRNSKPGRSTFRIPAPKGCKSAVLVI